MRRLFLCCFTLLLLACPALLFSQARAVVTGSVRNVAGDSLPNARVRAVGAGSDTTVRADAHGNFGLALSFGDYQLRVAMIGYEPRTAAVTVNTPEQRADMVLNTLAQQLNAVNVREKWIGIRGIIGDSTTMQPIAGALVATVRRGKRVVSDSAGRFEIPLEKAEQTVLTVTRQGYQARAAQVAMRDGEAADVVLFMLPGQEPKYLKMALVDLGHRMAWGAANSFVAGHGELARNGAKNLLDGIIEAGMLERKGLSLVRQMCLFVDGVPKPDYSVSSVLLANVDFVEVLGWGADEAKTLTSRWPTGATCGYNDVPIRFVNNRRNTVQFVSAWTRK